VATATPVVCDLCAIDHFRNLSWRDAGEKDNGVADLPQNLRLSGFGRRDAERGPNLR
jgi:hypothetical protein